MGAMKPAQPYKSKLNIKLRSVELQQYSAYTKFKDWVVAYTLDANVGIGKKTIVQFKLPYSFTYGQLANTHGFGDISLSLTRNVYFSEKLQINATIGMKIPTGNANKTTSEGLPLPMYYQQSLGTKDFVAGISASNRNWMFAFGYQQAFGTIDNAFLWKPWTDAVKNGIRPAEDSVISNKYYRSKELTRGKDIMFRVERNFRFSKISLNLGLLPIIRVTRDVVTIAGKREKQDGSQGLALTGLFGGAYHINAKMSLTFINGIRIIQREKNPDGLSREFVSNIGLMYKF
ncbi:MAG: hypothetical protein OHK0038_15700 [Flammeovirgaceae bacterium]